MLGKAFGCSLDCDRAFSKQIFLIVVIPEENCLSKQIMKSNIINQNA